MQITLRRGKAVLAGLLAVTAIGSAAPAQAHHARPIDCDARLERLESQFRDIEARFGYDRASQWWNEVGWPRYYRLCPGN
jgi:hypothetical protein